MNLPLLINARQVARAIQARVVRAIGPGVVQKLLNRQLGATQITGSHTGAGNAQLTSFALRQPFKRRGRASREAVGINHLDDHQAVIGQRRTNGDGLAGFEFGQTGGHRGLGRPIGVEHLARAIGPARHQRLGAHLAAQVDDAQIGHVLRKQRQQGGHGVQDADLLLYQCTWQGLGVSGDLARRQP